MNGQMINIILAFTVGVLGALQGTINSHIGKLSGQLIMIISVSIVQCIVAFLILLRGNISSIQLSSFFSPWIVLAGLLGVFMMFGMSTSIQVLGTLTVFVLVISGQVISSSIIDYFGLFGVKHPLNLQKIGSIVLILTGVIWLVKSS